MIYYINKQIYIYIYICIYLSAIVRAERITQNPCPCCSVNKQALSDSSTPHTTLLRRASARRYARCTKTARLAVESPKKWDVRQSSPHATRLFASIRRCALPLHPFALRPELRPCHIRWPLCGGGRRQQAGHARHHRSTRLQV